MLMDTLKGLQRNEAPIKSNRVPFYIISILHEGHVQYALSTCKSCITGRWRLALCRNGIALRLHNILRVPANTMQHRNRIYIIPSLTYYMFIF